MKNKIEKYFLPLILLVLFLPSLSYAKEKETIKYVVSYKWGLIQQDAGDAIITKTPGHEGYELKLTAKTKPWADRIYKMRDTLISTVGHHSYLPEKYVRIAHEKGKYSRDEIKFDHSGEMARGSGIKYREKKNGEIFQKDVNIEGPGPAFDFLSIFFHLREVDYASMKPGEKIVTSIFSGDKSEKLTVTPIGIETIKLKDKTEHETWHIVFNFTTKGATKSSDDIDCWISTDGDKLPLLIVGSLPVGQIRCHYVP